VSAPPSTLAWTFSRPIAHRGLHDRRQIFENTIAAAEAAIVGGYGIECDIQLSADGEAMVFHDDALERLTGRPGLVRERTAEDLSETAVGETSERIPTLRSFLDAIGGRTPLVIEIKSRFDGDERLTRRLADILDQRTDPVVVKSFDASLIALLRRIAPGIPRGVVAQSSHDAGATVSAQDRLREANELVDWERTAPAFLSWRHVDLPATFPHLRAVADIPIMSWTIRSQEDAMAVSPFADQIVFEGFVPDAAIAPTGGA
jgi:glycerophosphoryl diester phosphodiesterase